MMDIRIQEKKKVYISITWFLSCYISHEMGENFEPFEKLYKISVASSLRSRVKSGVCFLALDKPTYQILA